MPNWFGGRPNQKTGTRFVTRCVKPNDFNLFHKVLAKPPKSWTYFSHKYLRPTLPDELHVRSFILSPYIPTLPPAQSIHKQQQSNIPPSSCCTLNSIYTEEQQTFSRSFLEVDLHLNQSASPVTPK